MTRDELIEKMARAVAKKVYGHDDGWKQFYDVRETLAVVIEWLEGEAKKCTESKWVFEEDVEAEKTIRRLIAMLKEPTT